MSESEPQLTDKLNVMEPRQRKPWAGPVKAWWQGSPRRQLALVGATALLLGGGLGAGVTAAATPAGDDTDEYHALEDRLAQTVEEKDADVDEQRDQVLKLRTEKGKLEAAANDVEDREETVALKETELGVREAAVGAAEAAKKATEFGPGVHLVGADIQPGQYRNAGTDSCYWARLSSTSGDLGSIIANDNVDGQAIVKIAASDAAFTSSRCGTWTKIA